MSRRVIADKVTDMMSDWAKKDKEAQQEAVTRLGLPENNTATDRAKAMGFGDDVYHGTKADFDEFSLDKARRHKTIFTAPEPHLANKFSGGIVDEATAITDEFKNSFLNPKLYPPTHNPQVLPLKTRGKVFDYENPEHLKLLEDKIGIHNASQVKEVNLDSNWFNLENKVVQKAIKDLGFDGFNVLEEGVKNTGTYNPANIRSKFAHFNPKYAGIGVGSVMSGNLMADELDLEYKGQEPSTWDSLMNTIGNVNQQQAQSYGDTGAGTMEGTANIAHLLATDPAVVGEVIGGGALSLAGATAPWIKGFGAGLLLDSGEASASPKYSDEDFIKKLEGR